MRLSNIILAVLGFIAVLVCLICVRDLRQLITTARPFLARLLLAGLAALSPVACARFESTRCEHPALARAPEWTKLADLLTWAEQIASNDLGDTPLFAVEKQMLLRRLAHAQRDVDSLAARSLLSPSEANLLTQELRFLWRGVSRSRTKEERGVAILCYGMMPYRSVSGSYGRLQLRQQLLEQMLNEPTLHAPVVRKVVERVRRDIAELATAQSPSRYETVPIQDLVWRLRTVAIRLTGRCTD